MYTQIEKRKAHNVRNFNARSMQLKCKNCEENEEGMNSASSSIQRAQTQEEDEEETLTQLKEASIQREELQEEDEEENFAQLKEASIQRMVMQLYEDCEGSDHNSSIQEKSIVRNYNENFGGGGVGEYALDSGDGWRFADLVDTSDKEIYEIKTINTGADKAQEEAEYYLGLLKSNCSSKYKLGRTFGKQTIDMGQYFSLEYSAPKKGAITYENIELD